MVTGLVTVNGNSRAANGENTKRRHGSTQGLGWKLHHVTRKQNQSTHYNNPRETTQEQGGYYEPTTNDPRPSRIFPQFPPISPKLSARAVAALGGSSQVFSDDLLP